MIAVECRGRLGNQMFQYAFGLAAAKLLDTELAIDDEDLRRLFVLRANAAASGPRPERVVTVANDGYLEPEDVLARLTDDATYVGYFQSERFFSSVAEEVRSAFRLRPEHVQTFRARYGDLVDDGYVCCHMRRTDYHEFAGGVALPMSYYRAGLRRLAPPAGGTVVFVGDDLEEARAAFGDLDGARFERNEEPVDLQLLEHADAVVASNSTFCWWGAWLNRRPGARVVAPRHWIGFEFGWEYPPAVIPEDWTAIRVPRPWRRRVSPVRLRMSLGRTRNDVRRRIARLAGRRP